jgi:peroxiredoxin Q/BCP
MTHRQARTIVLSLLFFTSILYAAGRAAADKPPAKGDDAQDFELKDLSGNATNLSSLTAKGPVVLVVLRGYPGYQCPFCTKQFGDFLANADGFNKAGAQVVFIYPGSADNLKKHAEEFVNDKSIPEHFHLLLDPDYVFTNAYGLRWDGPKETAYPSTFIVNPKLKITFARISKTHGNRTKASDVLKALADKG